jgi:two-component system, sensor histidine kinase YesM
VKTILNKKITHISDSVSLKAKIIVIFFAFIIVPLTIFTLISYNRINNLVLTQTLNSASQSFNESISILEKYFQNMYTAMQNVVFDEDIYRIASKDTTDYAPIQQLEDYKTIVKRFDYIQKGADIDHIRFYINIDSYFSENNINIFSLSKILDKDWYNNLLNSGQSRLWSPPFRLEDSNTSSLDFFSYASIIYSMESLKQPLALLRVDVKKEKVEAALRNAVITKNSTVIITDGKEIIYPVLNDNKVVSWSNLADAAVDFKSQQWEFLKFDNKNYIVKSKQLKLTDWYVVAIIPQSDIVVLQNVFKNEMILILVLLATISYFLAYVTSSSSLKRIFLLNREMKKIESGDLTVSLKQVGKDEIGELMGSFNKMAARMAEMVDEKYIMGQEMKSAELRALQAQINPHFLYNSLDLVNCLAIQHSIPEITQMVTSLAKFYKLSLSQGNDVIPLKDELMHVQLYVQIQNLRFENRIKLILNIDPWINEYCTLKTILQPIIENSIIHGIFEKEDKSGLITISATMENSIIILKVEDDGIGMSEEAVEHILLEDKSSHRHGYGVKNTNDRIKLYYGHEYGLYYSSIMGKGTTVTIQFPAVKIQICK